ncbi:MAG TPA: MBL fold metallo-hydrolase [Bryobacteraceae bacterium]|jgi:cyclase|nr:MBL fold metallo-hydrolase [Bryobacteraceae bacterium]
MHTHNHPHQHSHNHAHPHTHSHSRRDFFGTLVKGTLAGAGLLELGHYRAAWFRAMAATADTQLFDIENVAPGVFFARARAQALVNANAAIFVNANDVLVVDSHSKPSAAASLIAQIKKEVTPNPVRYVVNSHFHWDHTQGNHAYRAGEPKIDFIASEATKKLMSDLALQRLKASLDDVPKQIDAMRARAAKAASAAEKAFCAEQIRQMQAYQQEMKNYALELPTITFATSHVIKDKAHELHIEFHGHAHTAGDVVVYCPQKRAISSGDMIHGILPFIADGFPKTWPKTIDSVAALDFNRLMPGHGPLQQGRQPMTSLRNYIEELTSKVDRGKKEGKTVADLQKLLTAASLKSLQSDGYAKYVADNTYRTFPNFGPAAGLQRDININIGEIYKNLDRL